jgi:hypothetical protein
VALDDTLQPGNVLVLYLDGFVSAGYLRPQLLYSAVFGFHSLHGGIQLRAQFQGACGLALRLVWGISR